MFDFFDVIITMLDTVVGAVVKFFEMLLFIISFIAQGVVYAMSCIAFLPAWVLPFVLAVIGFSVVMFILNR